MARTRTPITDPKKAIGYIRVSTDEQQLGPEAQRAALDAWCTRTGCELVACFTDQGISGGAPLDKRPALLTALAALKIHGAGVLVVAKRDRIARDSMVAAMVERLAQRDGATLRSTDGASDGEGPEAFLMRRIVDVFAEYERLMIAARTKAALAVKRTRGERISREAPYGHRLARDGTHLEVDLDEQHVKGLVQTYRAEGLTLRAIGSRLEAEGLLPRSGGRWNPRTVRSMVAG